MPNLGSPIPVVLLLTDRATNKFVRARIRDAFGADIAGSPAAVPHVGDGLYENATFVMPNLSQVAVTFRVYDDALFTQPSHRYPAAGPDIFELTFDSVIVGSISAPSDLKGIVEEGQTLEGKWDEGEIAEGNLPSDTVLSGEVMNPDEPLRGFVEPDDLEGTLEEDTTDLEGTI